MKIRIAACLLALIVSAVPVLGAGKPAPASAPARKEAGTVRERAVREGWPDTPAGLMAYEWVEAFSAGEEEMQVFLERHISPEGLKKRPMSERLATYRSLRERIGSLTLTAIEESSPAQLTASLLAEDASHHRFIFKVEPRAPHYLISVSTFDRRHGHGGSGGGH